MLVRMPVETVPVVVILTRIKAPLTSPRTFQVWEDWLVASVLVESGIAPQKTPSIDCWSSITQSAALIPVNSAVHITLDPDTSRGGNSFEVPGVMG